MFHLAMTIMLAGTLVIVGAGVVLCYRISNSIHDLSESVRNLAMLNANLQNSSVVCVDVPEPIVPDHIYTPVEVPLAPPVGNVVIDNTSPYINQSPYVNMRSSARNRHSLPCRSTSYMHMRNSEAPSLLSTAPVDVVRSIDFSNYFLPEPAESRLVPSLLEMTSRSSHDQNLEPPISFPPYTGSRRSSASSPFYP